jgi:hypothetical protein
MDVCNGERCLVVCVTCNQGRLPAADDAFSWWSAMCVCACVQITCRGLSALRPVNNSVCIKLHKRAVMPQPRMAALSGTQHHSSASIVTFFFHQQ